MEYRCYASCGFGIEGILARELRELELGDVEARDARVYFTADEIGIARANMWARTADRVYIVLDEFEAHTFDELFGQVEAIRFEELLPEDAAFPVDGNAVQSDLMSVSDIQSITKKAIVTAMKRKYHADRFVENGHRFNIFANNFKNTFTIALNTSGAGLSRRGYRLLNATAPLKETLAAALILIARWHHRDFYDPMCGSGTIAIEAAMMAANRAPGLKRSFDAQTYNEAFEEAFYQVRKDAERMMHIPEMAIFGSDKDPKVLDLAREHAKKAGVADWITFSRKDISDFAQPANPACIISNPPYAMRLGEKKEVDELYMTMGRVLRTLQDTVYFVLCESEQFEKLFGRTADKKRKLYNGNMKCWYYQYFRRSG